MTTYVLVAGAWHGSWCWSVVVPLLTAAGHRVVTPDLLGMTQGANAQLEKPLAVWADQIADVLRAEPEPVVLVGHSRAGLVISEVAERVPEKISLLVYLTAYLLKDGQTLNEVAQEAENAASFAQMVAFHDDGTATIKPEGVAQLFYNRTDEHLMRLAREQLVAEPIAAFITPVHLTESKFGSVPRAYIECADDQAIPLSLQNAMQAAVPVAFVDQLDSDHSPFFSAPEELAHSLDRLGSLAGNRF